MKQIDRPGHVSGSPLQTTRTVHGGSSAWRAATHASSNALTRVRAPAPTTPLAHQPRALRRRRAAGRATPPSPSPLQRPRHAAQTVPPIPTTDVDQRRHESCRRLTRERSTTTAVWDPLCGSIPMINMSCSLCSCWFAAAGTPDRCQCRSFYEPHHDRIRPDGRFAQKPTSRRQGIHETHPTRPPTLRNTASSLPHILNQGNMYSEAAGQRLRLDVIARRRARMETAPEVEHAVVHGSPRG